jgi:hypothetical protein
MGTDDKAVVENYRKFNAETISTESALENLINMKNETDPKTFNSLESEYKEKLAQIKPEKEKLEKVIQSKIEEINLDLERSQNKIDVLKKSIDQLRKLHKGGAISKNNYKTKLNPLEHELRQAEGNHKRLKSRMKYLKDAITVPPGTTKPLKGPFSGTLNDFTTGSKVPGSGFGRDFGRGCFIIVLILIGLPLLGLALWTSKLLIIPLVIVFVGILLIALFGKGLGAIGKWWR